MTHELSTFRLYVMRAAYVLIAVGLAVMIWPLLLRPPADLQHARGVMWALLAAVGLLAAIGIRHPVQMLPLLLFELTWKVVWLAALGLPARRAGELTGAWNATWFDCMVGVVVTLIAIPWPYVWRHYVTGPGDPWRPVRAGSTTRGAVGDGPAVGS